jgi:hypothetical protein
MQLLKNKTDYKSFIPHILANTVNTENDTVLPESAAISFVRNACINFAERTGIIKQRLVIDLQAGLSEYPLDALDCETIIGVSKAKMVNFESEDCGTRWSWGNVTFEFDDDVLYVHPAPDHDVDGGLELEIVLSPSRDSCEVDSVLYDKWFDAILNYALSEIHMMPGYPWSSVTRAEYRKRLYNEDVTRAIVRKVLKGNTQPLKVMPNPDFMVRRSAQTRW